MSLAAVVLFVLLRKGDVLDIHALDERRIERFDLILAKGQSVQSKLISLLNGSTDDYTHIGIIVRENQALFVLHATPDGTRTNGLRYDSLQAFLDLSHVQECRILRLPGLSDHHRLVLANEIERYRSVQRPFDYEFDNLSQDKIYCSELIWLIFQKAGLLGANAFDLTRPIYPTDFQDHNAFVSVNCATGNP